MAQIGTWDATVAGDFNVELICRSENAGLFWAIRDGLWHFVEVVEQAGAVSTSQWHIPRFTMAARLRLLQSMSPTDFPIVTELAPGLQLVLQAPSTFSIVTPLLIGTAPVPATAVETQLRQDVKILESARAEVSCDAEGDYFLAGATTAEGTPVRSSSQDVIAAIAFEWLTTGGLYPFSIGAYSAHSTCLDFKESERMSDDFIANLIKNSMAEDVSETRHVVRQWFAETERRLFSRPIWSEYNTTDPHEASRVLSEAMATLTRTQRVQFLWLNVMHEPSVMMPLAVLSGVVTFEEYVDARCEGWRPESRDAQARRMDIAWIKLYGEVAGDNPAPQGYEVVERPSRFADGEEIPDSSGMSRPINPSKTALESEAELA